jgi:hypothetical protein
VSAARERSSIAAIGCDLMAREGGPGVRRGAALLRRLDGQSEEAVIPFGELQRVPSWARLPCAAQQRIAERAALASIADDLAHSIDGAWLGGHATEAGEDAVDWAISLAGKAPALPPIAAEGLVERGFALLSATLDEPLRPLLDWAPATAEPVPDDTASACVSLAMQAPA